jgi:hypothetical protein
VEAINDFRNKIGSVADIKGGDCQCPVSGKTQHRKIGTGASTPTSSIDGLFSLRRRESMFVPYARLFEARHFYSAGN